MASEDLPANGHGGPADSAKPALRRRLRAARSAYVTALPPDERAALEAALAAILVAHLPPGPIAAYHPVGAEIDPRGLALLLAFPRTTRGGDLTFHAATAAWQRGPLGIPQPPVEAPRVEPGTILVPLLGVDRSGTRLGQGGGFYDRTLAALRTRRPVLAIGVAWDVQLVDTLPAEPWDEPLDALATPSQWLWFPRCHSG